MPQSEASPASPGKLTLRNGEHNKPPGSEMGKPIPFLVRCSGAAAVLAPHSGREAGHRFGVRTHPPRCTPALCPGLVAVPAGWGHSVQDKEAHLCLEGLGGQGRSRMGTTSPDMGAPVDSASRKERCVWVAAEYAPQV